MEFVDFLLQALIWYFIFRVVIGFGKMWNQAKQEVNEKNIEIFNAITHRVRVEDADNQIYWYDFDNGIFLAQGKTTVEIVEKLKDMYPTHFFFLEGDSDSVYRLSAPDWDIKLHRVE